MGNVHKLKGLVLSSLHNINLLDTIQLSNILRCMRKVLLKHEEPVDHNCFTYPIYQTKWYYFRISIR